MRGPRSKPRGAQVTAGPRPAPSSNGVSERMSKLATRDTGPEQALRRELHSRGLRYRVDVPPVPGVRTRADLVFRPSRVAVYVDGCFWHGCPDHMVLPKSNRGWWQKKLALNIRRDRATDGTLAELGWVVIRVWEHDDPASAADRIQSVVNARRPRDRHPIHGTTSVQPGDAKRAARA
jgi:DNA mismatch endonuclease (patch repair protein)